ncbi:MAG: PASTA domain-containing protein [Armatimonadetes bacterium]|nr:PASTA domain-containing protein [Armatimonadota bacterium]
MTGKPVFARRILLILIFSVLVLLAWIGRLFWFQVVWGSELRQQAAELRTRSLVLNPERGDIYDRNHNVLVASVPAFSVYAHPDLIRDPAGVARKIAPLLEMKEAEVFQKISLDRPFTWLKHKLSPEAAQAIKSLHLEGIGLVEGSKRAYPQGNIAAHLLGFVGDDNQGITGLEKSYDRELRGAPGRLVMESDAGGQPVPQKSPRVYPSSPGNRLVLTIDQTIQYFVERELDKIAADHRPERATIIVMDPRSGEILAMGSRPAFSPEKWNQVKQEVWEKNTATLYNYEPGSTLKMFIAAAALEEKVVRAQDTFYDPGFIVVNGRKIACWDKKGHGAETFLQAVENSCNPVFIQVGLKLGKERVHQYLRRFGFGAPTGVDLPGEESGIVRSVENTTDHDLAAMCIGQSISVTPLQLLNAVCAIANGGNLMKPYLVKAVEDDQGKVTKQTQPQIIRRVISPDTASELAEMLEKVVLEGTGKRARVEGYRIAGKTGTAQIPGPGGYLEGQYVASFAGFAPVGDPRIAVLVMMVDPKGKAYHGGEVAAPAFQNIVKDTLGYLGIPEEEGLHQEEKSPQPPDSSTTPVLVPNVTGYPAADARRLLESRGLVAGPSGSEGIVQEQRPPAGTPVARGGRVALKVVPFDPAQKTAGELTMPDLTGLSVKRAGEVCEALGLQPQITGSGVVKSQDPPPGTKVKRGAAVTLE